MQIRQISVFLHNKPGQLSAICRALADADINIAALSLADTSDFGIVRLIVDDHEKAKAVLAEKGNMCNVREVVAVCVPDRPGGMAEGMNSLDLRSLEEQYADPRRTNRAQRAVWNIPSIPKPFKKDPNYKYKTKGENKTR